MQAQVMTKDKKNSINEANFSRKPTFTWMLGIFLTGYKRDLQIDDLPEISKEYKSNYLGNKLSSSWRNELKRVEIKNFNGSTKNSLPNLVKALFDVFGIEFALRGIFFGTFLIIIGTTQPVALAAYIKYFSSAKKNSENSTTENDAYMYVGYIMICIILNNVIVSKFLMTMNHLGMKIRVACCSLIYRKVLKLSPTYIGNKTIGQALNLMSNDVNKLDHCIYLHYIWIGPLQVIFSTYFIYLEIGLAGIIGVICFLILIPFSKWIGKKSSEFCHNIYEKTDERIRLTNEAISGIEVIKMYCWEYLFSDSIKNARNVEVDAMKSAYILRIFMSSLFHCMPRVIIFITILCIIFLNTDNQQQSSNKLTASKIFMLIAYFEMIRVQMLFCFSKGILLFGETIASIKRIQSFMLYEEVNPETQLQNFKSVNNENTKKLYYYKNDAYVHDDVKPMAFKKLDKQSDNDDNFKENKGSIIIEEAFAKWLDKDTLSNLNMVVEPGQLVAVIGPVGSGKSSLLSVILKELKVYQGNVDIQGNIAYACQEPWIFYGSVKNNIIFGRSLDQNRYKQVIKVCQLERDLQLLPYNDKTIVGQRGISLSGGQRARINFARAVYDDASIYLFDDSLSSVDTNVGKNMFNECIKKYLKGKTRILVTHQIEYLKNVDRIIFIKDGKIETDGSYDELIVKSINFKILSASLLSSDNEIESSIKNQDTIEHKTFYSVNLEPTLNDDTVRDNNEEPVEVEESQIKGKMETKLFLAYFGASGSSCLVYFVFLLIGVTQILSSGGDWFIIYLIQDEKNYSNSTVTKVNDSSMTNRIFIFGTITIAIVILTFVQSFAFIGICTRASKHLHDQMFKSVIHATIRFFNANSSGRILNRFSKDLGVVDNSLPINMLECIQYVGKLFGIFTLVAITNYWLIIPAIIIGIIVYFLTIFYFCTSMSLKRLEGINKSPVLNHLSSSYQGLATIRSFNSQKILIKEFDNHQDVHSSIWSVFIITSVTYDFWLDNLCSIYACIVTMSLLIFVRNDEIAESSIGLVTTQIVGLIGFLAFTMQQITELGNQMTSVERVYEYTNLKSESPVNSLTDKKPEEKWPENGKIQFKNVYMSYDPSEAPVLKNLNFSIDGNEKIGIVGRTGAGKSSLISALFRLAYLEGEIKIDEIETKQIGLHDLRTKISIIPQEPFLIAGVLRKNLDPFDLYEDHVLRSALDDVELKEMDLQTYINERGNNLSVGQRQLVCLARAIIKNNKILILDEATANVDSKTDELIQKTIRKKFTDCTVVTIAHRLNTVMDSDKILVMDAGRVVEFDRPQVLLQNSHGAFTNMINQTGETMANSLRNLARDKHMDFN